MLGPLGAPVSVRLLAAALDHSTSRGSARLVLICLADRADDWGRCYPGKADLARRAGISRTTVTEALAELERLGELERDHRPGRSTLYRVTVGARTDEPDTTEGVGRIPADPPGRNPAPPGRTGGRGVGRTGGREPSLEPSPNRVDPDRAAVAEWHAGMRDAPGELVHPERFVEILTEARDAARRGESVQTRHRTGADTAEDSAK